MPIYRVPNLSVFQSVLLESQKLFNENPELYHFVVDELTKQKKFPKDPYERDFAIIKTAEKIKGSFKHDSDKR